MSDTARVRCGRLSATLKHLDMPQEGRGMTLLCLCCRQLQCHSNIHTGCYPVKAAAADQQHSEYWAERQYAGGHQHLASHCSPYSCFCQQRHWHAPHSCTASVCSPSSILYNLDTSIEHWCLIVFAVSCTAQVLVICFCLLACKHC